MSELPIAYSINRVHEHAPWGRSTTHKSSFVTGA
jgi:hypothetical protein